MSEQLDFWCRAPRGQQTDWVKPTKQKKITLTAESTLARASGSYLVPWFECMAVAENLGSHFVDAAQLKAERLMLGLQSRKTFTAWWAEDGFRRLGHAITSVKLTPPRGANVQASMLIPMSLPARQRFHEVEFLMEQLQHYQLGCLSSSPLLWPSFTTRITASTLMMYLRVLRCVLEQPEEARDKVFRVGVQLNLVPKHQPHSTDTVEERRLKREIITHQTYDYFRKGKALMINAVQGDFPNIKMPKDLVQTRRKPRKKITASRYDTWDTGARIVSAPTEPIRSSGA